MEISSHNLYLFFFNVCLKKLDNSNKKKKRIISRVYIETIASVVFVIEVLNSISESNKNNCLEDNRF